MSNIIVLEMHYGIVKVCNDTNENEVNFISWFAPKIKQILACMVHYVIKFIVLFVLFQCILQLDNYKKQCYTAI